MTYEDDCDAFHADEARRDADRGALVDAAMRDILAHNFNSFTISLAESEGVMKLATFKG